MFKKGSRRWWLLGAVLLCSASFAAPLVIWGASPRGGQPTGLICEAPAHDFGKLSTSAASDLRHEFRLRNTGRRTIRITQQTASCGCTTAQLANNTVPPGATLTVPVQVKW